ncbi:hypothetical protein EDM53_02790 [Rickettsiales endosymbiont of Peranema trichophorum]|uniref:hypothetical protein n=1 Tax=Rickettsiales endosymbiont of Peranema trichophorum TaxID=2486577 RepID=UPI001022CC8B|nr:hypothetical protein [Rickettsiales endosymbiont of Peranema trichophorum]RZI47277.1 hypothetical protein EDM53_02790 [Rickettsiales endosymbiont of Peranema trichophorum]
MTCDPFARQDVSDAIGEYVLKSIEKKNPGMDLGNLDTVIRTVDDDMKAGGPIVTMLSNPLKACGLNIDASNAATYAQTVCDAGTFNTKLQTTCSATGLSAASAEDYAKKVCAVKNFDDVGVKCTPKALNALADAANAATYAQTVCDVSAFNADLQRTCGGTAFSSANLADYATKVCLASGLNAALKVCSKPPLDVNNVGQYGQALCASSPIIPPVVAPVVAPVLNGIVSNCGLSQLDSNTESNHGDSLCTLKLFNDELVKCNLDPISQNNHLINSALLCDANRFNYALGTLSDYKLGQISFFPNLPHPGPEIAANMVSIQHQMINVQVCKGSQRRVLDGCADPRNTKIDPAKCCDDLKNTKIDSTKLSILSPDDAGQLYYHLFTASAKLCYIGKMQEVGGQGARTRDACDLDPYTQNLCKEICKVFDQIVPDDEMGIVSEFWGEWHECQPQYGRKCGSGDAFWSE